jgi:hypothetical protein
MRRQHSRQYLITYQCAIRQVAAVIEQLIVIGVVVKVIQVGRKLMPVLVVLMTVVKVSTPVFKCTMFLVVRNNGRIRLAGCI